MTRPRFLIAVALTLAAVLPAPAAALERICDPAFEDCRAPLLDLINSEPASGGIDVAFWFMEDARYSAALYNAKARGVPVRVLFDSEELDPSNPNLPTRQFIVDQIKSAGIPMIEKVSSGINHWKLMLFVAQNTVQFSGGNYTGEAFVYNAPYSDYVDEVIYFTDKQNIVNSFKKAFDDVWVNTEEFANYANVTTRQRTYPATLTIDPELQFYYGFRERSVAEYNAEPLEVDAIIYRITDRAHTDALIDAVLRRGVHVRLISEPHQYSDESRLWHRWNVDRLYMAGLEAQAKGLPGRVEIRHRKHLGLTHEKLTILRGQGMTIFGSSNWSSASSDAQLEHNWFTRDPNLLAWSIDHFERKWNNTAPNGAQETEPFVPLGPAAPILRSPANGATGQPVSMTLLWDGGYWAHKYDVYIGTSPSTMAKVQNDVEQGPFEQTFNATGLSGGTTYYWQVVGRTMANLSAVSPIFSFTTAGTPSGNTPPAVALTSPVNGANYTAPATITLSADAQDFDGFVARVEFYNGATRIGFDDTAPFGITWSSVPAGNYSLTARAIDNAGGTTTSSPVNISVGNGAPVQLPAPWVQQDIGGVGVAGNASVSGGTWTVSGSGTDVWGTSDQFHYVYQPMNGNGSIIARVTAVENVDPWTKAGVMIRESTAAGASHGFMIITPGATKGYAFQRRTVTNGTSSHTAAGSGAPPKWVKLTRTGSTVTAFVSDNGVDWALVGSDTITMSAVTVGLAVSSHNNGVTATAMFDNVSVVPESGGPPPNTPPFVSVTSPANGSSFTAPATITVNADASDPDGSISRVDFFSGSTPVGSDSTAPYSVTITNVAQGSYTLTAQAVDNAGATASSSVNVTVGPGSPPPLPAPWNAQDVGAVGAAGSESFSGGTWTVRGSGADVWGTADAFHFVYQQLDGDGSIVARVASVQNVDQWTKAGVMIRAALTPGAAHGFMFATPTSVKGLAFQRRPFADGTSAHTAGSAGTPPVWVKLTRTGTTVSAYQSPDGVSWTFVGSDTIALGASAFVGLAVASHADGTVATATFDNVSVEAAGPPPVANTPPSVNITSPSSGATFTAPATITLSANASDSDGTVARVDFFFGSTPIGTDQSSPYSLTWSNVAAGTYTITARATDNGGAQTTSSSVTVTVNGAPPGPLPSGWSTGDIGAVGAAGSAGFSNGTFTVQGSGADIWDTADEFRFAYRTMTGDGAIVARVDSIDAVNQWTKAGVMIRAALTPGSRHAMMVASVSKGLAFQRRVTDGGLSTHTAGSFVGAPIWVRLQRSGSTITASTSPDGVTWTVVGSETIAMPNTVFIGLAVTSHSDGVLATASFSNVTP